MSLLALTISAALAQSATATIETPPEYVDCLKTASKEAALDYENIDNAVPRVMAACENVWDSFERQTLRRLPDETGTLAELKSRMREQVREVYTDNSTTIQKRDFMRDMADSAAKGERLRALQSLMKMYVDCHRKAAREAFDNGMKSDRIGKHADKDCGHYGAEVAKRLPRVLAESLVAGSDISAAEIEAYNRKSTEKMLDGMRRSGRRASALVIEEARRWESCTAKGNPSEICELNEELFRAMAAYEQCLGTSARRSAKDGDEVDDALSDVERACAEEWSALEKLSKRIGDSEAVRTQYRVNWHARFERDYPKLVEQARLAGDGAQ